MVFARRALLYVARKRGKTLTLFLIIFVVAVLGLSSWAIRGATETAQLNVRQALGGTISLEGDTSNPDNWKSRDTATGSQQLFAGDPIDAELGRKIAEGVDGIKGYSASVSNVLIAETAAGEPLELVEGEDGDASLAAGFDEGDDFTRTSQVFAVTNSTWDPYFANGYLKLVEGEPITEDSGDGVLVSRPFAELNGLQVGDTFTLRRATVHAQMMGVDVEDTRTPVTVAGIFEPTAKSTASLASWSMDNAVFSTMETLDHARPGTAEEGFERLSFQVSDPGQLERIAGEIEALDAVAGHGYAVSADTSEVNAVTKPLENMDRLVTVLAVAAIAVGAVILYLVLASRVRDRMHESGVLLSLGFARASIVGQYLTEALVVAAVAFALAVPASGFAAERLGDALLGYANAEAAEGSGAGDGGSSGVQVNDGMGIATGDAFTPQFEGSREVTEIDVRIEAASVAALLGVGCAIVGGAVLLASVPLHRLSPREIMTTLS